MNAAGVLMSFMLSDVGVALPSAGREFGASAIQPGLAETFMGGLLSRARSIEAVITGGFLQRQAAGTRELSTGGLEPRRRQIVRRRTGSEKDEVARPFINSWEGMTMNHSRWLSPLAATVLILIGLFLLGLGCRNLWRAFASPSSGWPVAAGTIRSSAVEEYRTGSSTSRNRTLTFWASIVFEYSVNGQKYTSGTVSQGQSGGSADSSEAELLHLRYPKGAAVAVHYDPADPSIAVLEPGSSSDLFWPPGLGLMFLAPGIAFWMVRGSHAAENGWVYLCGDLIAAGVGIAGAAMLATGVGDLRRAWDSRRWPVTPGVMVCSPQGPENSTVQEEEERDAQRTATGGASRSTGLVYEYEVNGRTHYGRVWRWGGLSPSNLQSDPERARRYAVGQPVQVAYPPDHPDLAVLEPGVSSDAYWIPALGAFLLLAGLAMGLFAIPALARIRVSVAPEAEGWLRRMQERENRSGRPR
ncbi:MAG: DUF3592 domain-containing protein [Deltaproteobacteria bacterium]|nr:DUF3592 domain-containing protein [Deltaproteobacteria bacterium]